MAERGYTGGGSAEDARPPAQGGSGASRPFERTIDWTRDPLALSVRVTPIPTSEDEGLRDAVAYLGEVYIGSVPVFGHRYLRHVSAPIGYAERECGERAAAEFAMRLREVLGYDPEEARR